MRKLSVISHNTKGLHTFDLTRKDSNCKKYCSIAAICYINNNLQDKLNKKYIKKMKRNFKLLNSDKFVKVVSNEIFQRNLARFRFFSNGDIIHANFKKSDIQINNIFKCCYKNKNIKFWLTTRNFNAFYRYITQKNNLVPENLNIMLSLEIDEVNDFIIKWAKENKISVSQIVLTKKESNCLSSQNGKSCTSNLCSKCFDYGNRYFYIHGKNNKQKLRELIKIESRR